MSGIGKLKSFITDSPPIKEKVVISLLAGFAFSFNFVFFGMLYIYIGNYEAFIHDVAINDLLNVAVYLFLLVFLITAGVLLFMPGKVFAVVASLITGVILAGYLQGNVLNNAVDLGRLTGDSIIWHEMMIPVLINTAIWFVLVSLPVVLRYFATSAIWTRVVIFICVLPTLMQGAALISEYMTKKEELGYRAEYYLSRKETYEVSSTNNIMVFVIDRLDYAYIDAIREIDPLFFDRLDGFTDFTNAAAVYEGTFPSGVFMTTGVAYDYEMKRADYFDYAWNNSEFIMLLKDAGYTMNYHMGSGGYMYSDYEQLAYAADNLKYGRKMPVVHSIRDNFTVLLAYRFAPLALKPFFWMPAVDFEMTAEGILTERDYVFSNDPFFLELLNENGLSLHDGSSNYLYLHLHGSHAPYTMDENGMFAGETDVVAQTKGSFNILYQYMDEMKRLGVYEDSTIIILGDHGWGPPHSHHIGFFVKPRGSAGTPLVQNNAPISMGDNMLATLLKSEGLEYEQFGMPAFDVEQDTLGERYTALYTRDGLSVAFYRVIGHIRDFDNWELIDVQDFPWDTEAGLPID